MTNINLLHINKRHLSGPNAIIIFNNPTTIASFAKNVLTHATTENITTITAVAAEDPVKEGLTNIKVDAIPLVRRVSILTINALHITSL